MFILTTAKPHVDVLFFICIFVFVVAFCCCVLFLLLLLFVIYRDFLFFLVTFADKDECEFSVGLSCGGESECVNGLNQYTCKCAPGWTVNETTHVWIRI